MTIKITQKGSTVSLSGDIKVMKQVIAASSHIQGDVFNGCELHYDDPLHPDNCCGTLEQIISDVDVSDNKVVVHCDFKPTGE
jgi:hypothetical protein